MNKLWLIFAVVLIGSFWAGPQLFGANPPDIGAMMGQALRRAGIDRNTAILCALFGVPALFWLTSHRS